MTGNLENIFQSTAPSQQIKDPIETPNRFVFYSPYKGTNV